MKWHCASNYKSVIEGIIEKGIIFGLLSKVEMKIMVKIAKNTKMLIMWYVNYFGCTAEVDLMTAEVDSMTAEVDLMTAEVDLMTAEVDSMTAEVNLFT